jgi:hypothetical protein
MALKYFLKIVHNDYATNLMPKSWSLGKTFYAGSFIFRQA